MSRYLKSDELETLENTKIIRTDSNELFSKLIASYRILVEEQIAMVNENRALQYQLQNAIEESEHYAKLANESESDNRALLRDIDKYKGFLNKVIDTGKEFKLIDEQSPVLFAEYNRDNL